MKLPQSHWVVSCKDKLYLLLILFFSFPGNKRWMHVCTEQGLYSLVLIIFTALVFWVTNVKVSVHTVAREFIMTKTYVNLMHLNIDLRLNKKKTLNFKFVYRNNLKNSGDNQFVKEKKRISPPKIPAYSYTCQGLSPLLPTSPPTSQGRRPSSGFVL